MKVLSLTARGFRNLEPLQFSPHEGLNVICGENAQGKTNLLEAMWLFTGGRSFRGAKDAELVRVGEEQARTAERNGRSNWAATLWETHLPPPAQRQAPHRVP